MLTRIRYWIVCLLCLALSGQSFAVAALRVCHQSADSAARITVAAQDSGASYERAQGTGAHGHAEHHAKNEPGDSEHAASHKPDSPKQPDRVKCAACAGCCHFAALPVTFFDPVPHFDATNRKFSPLDVPRVRNTGSGLERPPRT